MPPLYIENIFFTINRGVKSIISQKTGTKVQRGKGTKGRKLWILIDNIVVHISLSGTETALFDGVKNIRDRNTVFYAG